MEEITEIGKDAQNYIELKKDLFKLKLLKKITRSGSYMLSSIVIMITILFALLLVSFAFSFWYGKYYGNIHEAFLICAVFYVIVAVFVYVFRKQLFSNHLIKNLSGVVFSDEMDHKDGLLTDKE